MKKITEKQIKYLTIISKSFSNQRRIRLLIIIKNNNNLNVEQLSEKMKINYQTIAPHLQKLERAGLIKKSFTGKDVKHKILERGEMIIELFGRVLN